MSKQPLPSDSSTAMPTEAETRAVDLETQDPVPDPDGAAATPEQRREEKIRRAAYERYLQRGGSPAGDVDDWLEAEREFEERKDRNDHGT